MAERIQGLSIGLDLDTLKLDSGLTDLRSKLRLVNSEMKSNMSAFDRGDKSVEKYQTRIDGLNKKIEVQRAITEKAQKHYEKMVKEHGEGSREAEKAATQYNNQATALNNLERYVTSLTDELKELKEQQRIAESGWGKLGTTFEKTGKKLTDIGKSMKDVGNKLTKRITLPAMGAISALGGIALVKGFDRLVGIDNAQAKLKGLGHDAENVEKIMNSALDAVKGTSFGMDEAATTAANAVAAGIKPGKELTRYLSLTGDAAAIAGSSMSEMGSIINQVQTSQVAYTDNLNQLSDRGIPIYQWLGEEAGVAASEVKKMASDGEISSEMFLKAIEKNIGGAAQTMGEESFTAGLSNMWAAVGRLGASFLDAGGKGGGFFSQLKPLISDFTGRIDDMGDFAEKAGVKFGEFFTGVIEKVKSAKKWYDELSPSVQNIIKKFAIFGSIAAVALGPVLTVLGTLGMLIGGISTGLGTFMTVVAKAGGLLKWMRIAFMALGGPISLIVAAVVALGLVIYKNWDSIWKWTKDIFGKVGSFLSNLWQDTSGWITEKAKEIWQSIKDAWNTAYTWTVDTYNKIKNYLVDLWNSVTGWIVGKVQEIWQGMKDAWNTAYKWTTDTFRKIGKFLTDTWTSIYTTVSDFAKKVYNAIVTFFTPIVKFGTFIFTTLWSAISAVMNAVFTLITEVLKKVYDVVVQQLTKAYNFWKVIFTGIYLFFKKIWDAVYSYIVEKLTITYDFLKDILTRAYKFWKDIFLAVYNYVANIAIKIYNYLKEKFTNIYNLIVSIFTSAWKFLSKTWNQIYTFLSNVLSKIYNFFKNIFVNIYNFLRDTTLNIYNNIKDRFTKTYNTTTSIFTDVWNFMKDIWRKVYTSVSNRISNIFTKVRDTWTNLKKRTAEIFSEVYNGIKEKFDDIVQLAKDLPGKMKDGLVEMSHKVYEGMKSIANKMARGLGKGVNGVIDGVNWVTGKLGVKAKIEPWVVPEYAQGTDSHPGGLAVVGDGKGSNAGSELIRTGNSYHLSPDKPTLVNLPKGAEVLPASITKQLIPHYAWGTKLWAGTKDVAKKVKDSTVKAAKTVGTGIKTGATAVKDFGINVWDYAKNPGKLLNLALKALGVEMPSGATTLGKIAKGGFTTVKDKAVGFIKKKMDELLDFGGGSAPTSGGANAWRTMILRAAARMGEAITTGELNGIIAQIQRESGGNQSIVQSRAVWDVNWANNNPARGLLQYIPQTFNAYKVPGHGNINSGYDQLLAFFNNKSWRRDLPYGKRGWGPRGGRKYASGGLIKNSGLYQLAEEGFPEWIIPTDPSRRTDAMKLLALAGKDIQGNKRPNQLPNVSSHSDGGGVMRDLLEATLQQNQILMQLLKKDNNVYLDSDDITKKVNENNAINAALNYF